MIHCGKSNTVVNFMSGMCCLWIIEGRKSFVILSLKAAMSVDKAEKCQYIYRGRDI